ncbi:MAG: hypothetical protein H7Y07_09205 [Pyrinomonadaceae bacterium]|nr:hypothetical protein [Sphingobacteriaceae bacterium]
MKVNRRTIYNWFKRPDLPFIILNEIGHILNHDFSIDFPDMKNIKDSTSFRENLNILQPVYSKADTYQYWMLKYLELLERYNKLTEIGLRKSSKSNQI